MIKHLLLFFFICCFGSLPAQVNGVTANYYIVHYDFQIKVSDENDSIFGLAILKIQPNGNNKQLVLNLKNLNKEGKGMQVQNVMDNVNNIALPFIHNKDLLTISPTKTLYSITIRYKGIPADGLIIGMNKFGSRTWFGDNWPNRAQHWIPCIDHPSAKATVRWTVICPAAYTVTANGIPTLEISTDTKNKKWVFEETHPIPVKVAVIGIAMLQKSCMSDNCLNICNLYYPQTYNTQPAKMDEAIQIVKFYAATIGEYPFSKLYNVQSTTRFGGMENAANIFYDESRVDGTDNMDDLIAHEIAHQWFGNTVTEKDFSHLWLSEGFATFFTNYYLEKKYGTDTLQKRLKADREKVKSFLAYTKKPVIDNSSDYLSLLNANSYEKGGLFLQALRQLLGDEVFFAGIRKYFSTYKYKNASTEDFRNSMEQSSKKNLKDIFNKWLYSTTLPPL